MNPADLPSRGCSPLQLVMSKWWQGPAWLKKTEPEWPCITQHIDENEVNKEIKKSSLTQMINVNSSDFKASDLFANYTKLFRFMS